MATRRAAGRLLRTNFSQAPARPSFPRFPHRSTGNLFKIKTSTCQKHALHTRSPALEASRVTIEVGGRNEEYSPLLLRDLCECSACVHPSTKQRLFSTAEIPQDLQVKDLSYVDENGQKAVKITWSDNSPHSPTTHVTLISLGVLAGINAVGAAPGPFKDGLEKQILWTSETSTVPDVDFSTYMRDDSVLFRAIKALRTHGLIFVTGIPDDEAALVKIATRIGPMKDTFYGHTWDVRTVPAAINAAYTSQDLGFHTDLLYFQNPPHIQLLHCIQSSSAGGVSVFADAFQAALDLHDQDEAAFNTLASVPVNYQYKHPDSNLYHTTKRVIELRPLQVGNATFATASEYLAALDEARAKGMPLPDISLADCIEKINWGPPFMAPFSLHEQSAQPPYPSLVPRETLNRKFEAWHAAATKFNALLHRSTGLHERLMKSGECVLFDNTRVLHARRSFEAGDVGKPRWLKGGYVDKDPYLSRYLVLRSAFGNSTAVQ